MNVRFWVDLRIQPGFDEVMTESQEAKPDWAVTLRPNRSMTREGVVAMIAIVAALNLSAALVFLVAGAWPILGFLGFDVAIIWWAMKRNWADGERYEQIQVSGDELTLKRFPVAGAAKEMRFNKRWLRIDLEFDEARELVGRLFLAYRNERFEVGSFLGAEDRQSLAKALRRVVG
jgi:uncharacterized membrane protein